MRISRETIYSTFNAIVREKEEKYLARHPRPIPPTDKEIVEAIRKGDYKTGGKCSCEVRGGGWDGYVSSFPLSDIIKVGPIEAYKKKAAAHQKRLDAFKASLTIRKKEDIAYCMFGPGQTEKGTFYARAEEFKKWNP